MLDTLKGKSIALVGLGIEGLSTAEYFLTHNISFAVYDEKSFHELSTIGVEWQRVLGKLEEQGIAMQFGKPLEKDMFAKTDILVRSPGISLKAAFFADFRGVMTSHTKLFFDLCPANIIGVTGTKGKGTTSSLIYEMLKKAGFDAYLGGNIGLPPLSFLDTLTTQSLVVLEMSSFQLQDMQKSPHISVMLMVTQEHLDSFGNQNAHATVEEYWEAKRNIFAFQTVNDMAVLNTDYPATKKSAEKTVAKVSFVSRFQEVENGCFVRDNKVILRSGGQETEIIDIQDIRLPGGHNLENICAASMAVWNAGVGVADMAFVLRTFKGLEHRLELVREVRGVRYYDDSFSTVPETAIAAIFAFTAPEIVILGGSSKGSNFSQLGKLLSGPTNVKAVIGIGIEWQKIKEHIQNPQFKIVEGLQNMHDIVAKAGELSVPGDVVLLSPACASFDMFKNYKDRGNQFKEHVNLL